MQSGYFVKAALLVLMVLAQVCVSWPIRGDLVFRQGGLKELKTLKHSTQRGNTVLQHWKVWEN